MHVIRPEVGNVLFLTPVLLYTKVISSKVKVNQYYRYGHSRPKFIILLLKKEYHKQPLVISQLSCSPGAKPMVWQKI